MVRREEKAREENNLRGLPSPWWPGTFILLVKQKVLGAKPCLSAAQPVVCTLRSRPGPKVRQLPATRRWPTHLSAVPH